MKTDAKTPDATPAKRKAKRRRAVAAIAVAAVAVAAAAFFALNANKKPPVPEAALAAAARGPLEDKVSASGSFQAERYSVVSSRAMGIVKAVLVKPGDRVAEGDVIVEVDEREAKEALATAEIALEETRRTLVVELASLRSEVRRTSLAFDQAKRAAESAEKLRAVDGIPEEDLRKAREELERSRMAREDALDKLRILQGREAGRAPSLDPADDAAVVAAAPAYRRAALAADAARRALEGCSIRAEGDGIVTELGVAAGDRIRPETVAARIEDLASVVADVNVDEVDVGKIAKGMGVAVTADSLLGAALDGRISRIWPIVKGEGGGRVCRVRIDVDLAGRSVLSGASCMARIACRVKDDALAIPASALIPGAKPAAVWVAVPIVPAEDKTADATKSTADATQSTADATKSTADAKNLTVDSTQSTADAKNLTVDSTQSTADGTKPTAGAAKPKAAYKVTRREVTLGASTVNRVEVLEGLAEGDQVVVDNLQAMSEGAEIKARDA